MGSEPDGATPPQIVNHPFAPEGEWWTQCATCGLSEAAHFTTTLCVACGGAGGDFEGGQCGECEGTGIGPETEFASGRDVSRQELEGDK
jgi:hypothetical protein